MLFRSATKSDVSGLIDFYGTISDAMAETAFDCMWRRGSHPSNEMICEAVSAGTFAIADDCGTIAAAVIVNHGTDTSISPDLPWIVACSQDEVAVIHILAAAPNYRGTGIARDLLVHVIDTARTHNMRTLRLEAATNNTPAVKLYESCGFVPIIVEKRLWGSRLVDAVAMELPL